MATIAKNRRAYYDYEITDTVEGGIMLTGQEVKSCRQGHVNLAGAYVSFLGGKPILKGAKIAPYRFASGLESYNPGRDRPLLLKKAETNRLLSSAQEKGVSIIPLEVRTEKHVKILLGVGIGKKRHDKRQRIREREQERKLKRGEDY